MASVPDITYGLGVSPLSTVLYSYRVEQITLAALDSKWTWSSVHPEHRRRVLAAWFSHPKTVKAGVDAQGRPILHSPMGIGSGGRATGPAAVANFWSRNSRVWLPGRPSRNTPEGRAWLKPGMAPIAYPGSSLHEEDAIEGHGASIDQLGWQDGWFEANCRRFGIETFSAPALGGEKWHTHFLGWPKSKSQFQAAYNGGRRLVLVPLPVFGTITVDGETCDCEALKPVDVPEAPRPVMPVTDFEHGHFGLWPLNPAKKKIGRKLALTDSSDEFQMTASYAQGVLKKAGLYKSTVDGLFGRRSESATKAFQKSRGLKVDGWIGSQTWAAIDRAASS